MTILAIGQQHQPVAQRGIQFPQTEHHLVAIGGRNLHIVAQPLATDRIDRRDTRGRQDGAQVIAFIAAGFAVRGS